MVQTKAMAPGPFSLTASGEVTQTHRSGFSYITPKHLLLTLRVSVAVSQIGQTPLSRCEQLPQVSSQQEYMALKGDN